MKPKYFLDQDGSSHWYLVPVAIKAEWDKWTELDEDDERAWTPPVGAIAIGGHPNNVEFEAPILWGESVGAEDLPSNSGLEGEIKVGDELIWMPNSYAAREEVTVTKIDPRSKTIWMRSKNGETWNDEDRVREACIRKP